MSNPIKSASTPNTTQGAQGASGTLPADWLARLGAERGPDGNGANSFARWMSQHTQSAQPQISPAATNTPAASPKPASTTQAAAPSANPTPAAAKSGPGWTTAQARLAAQRSQSSLPAQSAALTSASQMPTKVARANASQHASSPEATEQAQNSQDTQRAHGAKASKEAKGTQQGSATDGVGEADAAEGNKDEVKYTTALGDGTAIVRELTPPSGIQANDPAGMMAWLAHLTQSGGDGATAAHGSDKGLEGSGQETSSDGAGLSLGQVDDGRGSNRGRGLGEASGRGAGLGLSALSMAPDAAGKGAAGEVRSDIALQTEALMGRTSDREAVDPAALLASDGTRIASFGQTLAEVRQASPNAQATLSTPLDAPDFSQKLADQVSLWVGQARNDGPMTAELHLNPAEMGPINVKISLDGQTAHVDFAAAALETRQAIQDSLSMLSSSLTDVGLSLSGGGVFSQTSQQQAFAQGAGSGLGNGGGNGQQRDRNDGSASDDDALSLRQVSAPRSNRLGGLDLYA